MKITLHSSMNKERFVCTNEAGKAIVLGQNEAVGPMESVLMAIAGCSTIDLLMILKKMRQNVVDVKVSVKAKRRKEHPKTFKKIKIHYTIYGKAKNNKVEEAIDLSLNKYCSVSKMIEKSAKIVADYDIVFKE